MPAAPPLPAAEPGTTLTRAPRVTPVPATPVPVTPAPTVTKTRLLSGIERSRPTAPGSQTAIPRSAEPVATVAPGARAAAPARSAAAPPPSRSAASPSPGWLKAFVIGGVMLALGMPASVLMARSMLAQSVLSEPGNATAALICTGGEGRALDGSNLMGWLFGGSYFQCGNWETRDARVQRERDQAEVNYLARERARQQTR